MDGIKGSAVLFSEMTPRGANEAVFNAWYDDHHMPSHVRGVPGFLSGQRYKSPHGPHYLAVYELDSPAALETDEYRTRKYSPDPGTEAVLSSVSGFTRYIGVEQHAAARPGLETAGIDAPVVLAIFFAVPFDRAPAFDDWYDSEHIPMLLDCPDWLMARRLSVAEADPEPYSHMMLHYLNEPAALDSDAAARARTTERQNRLAEEPWFMPQGVLYHRRRERILRDS